MKKNFTSAKKSDMDLLERAESILHETSKKHLEYAQNLPVDKARKELSIQLAENEIIKNDFEAAKKRIKLLERKIAAKKLIKKNGSNNLLNMAEWIDLIYNTASDAVFLIKIVAEGQYRVISVNRSYLTSVGIKLSDVVGKTPREILPAKKVDFVLGKFMEAISAGRSIKYEEEVEINGIEATVWTILTPIINKQGKPAYLLGISHDITQWKEAELKIFDSQLKYSIIANNTFDWEFWQAPDDSYVYHSPSCKRITGYSAQEFLTDKNLLVNIIHPEDRIKYKIHRELASKKMIAEEIEFRIIHTDGSIHWIDHVCQPVFDSANNFLGTRGSNRDATGRKEQETALKESESKFRLLFENMAQGVFYQLADGTFTEINPAALKIFGLTREQFLERNANYSGWRFIDEAYNSIPLEMFPPTIALNSGKQSDSTIGVFNPLKEDYIWVNISARPQFMDGDMFPYRAFVTMHDMTSRRKMEEIIFTANQRLKLAMRLNKAGIYDWDIEENKFYWSEEMYDIFGLDQDVLPGFEAWERRLHPDDLQVAEQNINRAIHSKTELINDYRIILPWNEIRWIRAVGNTIYRGETPSRMLGLCFDITETRRMEERLKESELMYHSLFDSMKDVFFVCEIVFEHNGAPRDFRYIDVNNVTLSLLNLTRGQIIGHVHSELFPKNGTFDEWLLRFARIADTGQPERFEKYAKGLERHFEVNAFSPRKGLCGVIMYDITERVKSQETLLRSEEKLRSLNSAKDRFLSIIGHDLRNPFLAILGYCDFLLEDIHDNDFANVGKYALSIKNSSKRAMDLIMNLLDWAQSQSGRITLNKEYFDLRPLITQIVELFIDQAGQKAITISDELPESFAVFCDKAMLSTIMRNLVSNAVKFTRPEGRIKISAEKMVEGVKITVADSGVGMDKEIVEKLFSLGQSISTPGTQNEKGSGLGLNLCREFVEKQGGRIWVESIKGEGSSFIFIIPADDLSSEMEADKS